MAPAQMLSLEEVARRFGVSRQTVLSWITRGLQGNHLVAVEEPHSGPTGKRYLVAEDTLVEWSIATGRQPRGVELVHGDTMQLELELAFERTGRIAAESQIQVLEERLGQRTEEVARLRADLAALQEAFSQHMTAFTHVAGRLGATSQA